MEVRIGITGSAREITLETDSSADEIRASVEKGLTSESKLVAFEDNKGRQVLVPGAALAYIEFGTDTARRVGFVS